MSPPPPPPENPLPPPLQHLGSRILLSSVLGGSLGLSLALLRGAPPPLYALPMAANFPLAATAALAPALAVHHLAQGRSSAQYPPDLPAHVAGGLLGGAFVGTLFRSSPRAALPGAALLGIAAVPVAFAEGAFKGWWEEERERRLQRRPEEAAAFNNAP